MDDKNIMKIAIVQITSSNNIEKNLALMEDLVKKAAAGRAQAIAFPELAYFMGNTEEWLPLLERFSHFTQLFASWALRYSILLIPGSLREPVKGDGRRYYNTLPVFDRQGNLTALYRKIFLFKAILPEKTYDEAADCTAGNAPVTFSFGEFTIGLGICFDLRFPELFRSLKKRGAQIVILPSAFTVPTGTAHWDVLTRTRAIENQLFFLAPAQSGLLGTGFKAYGHSRIISPWGEVLSEMKEGEGLIFGEISPDAIQDCRNKVDAWSARREDLFPIR